MSGLFKLGGSGGAVGGGDVVGQPPSTDEAFARFDGTTGKLIQNSVLLCTDAGVVTGNTQLDVDNIRLDGNTISSTSVNGNITMTPNGSGVIAGTELTLVTPLDELYGGTGQSTYAAGDTLYASATNTLSKLAKPTYAGARYMFDGTNVAWSTATNFVMFYEDFTTTNNLNGNNNLTRAVVDTGSNIQGLYITVANNDPGTMTNRTGAGTAAGAIVSYGSANAIDWPFVIGGGEITVQMRVRVSALSDGTNTYAVRVGFGDIATPAAINDGICFEYTSTVSANWYRTVYNAGTPNATDTTVAASTTFQTLKIVINAAGTSAEFFINGVSVGTDASTFPTGSMGWFMYILKSAGTTSRDFTCDYVTIYQKLTSTR